MARDEAYRSAEQRLEAARQEGATELDLSGLGLTEVPEALAQLCEALLPGMFAGFVLSLVPQQMKRQSCYETFPASRPRVNVTHSQVRSV